ncbi:hypothetical protein EDF39_2877 [Frondihabitans sp. PhB161]|nr:hypothetical protein EDF37_2809 [Frondihabitans sp. PhB153]RPF04447.1 hypothetical protein EDF39_2877 [Frondihabitans sp. PhB161]
MHKKQVDFRRTATEWWVQCVHCGECRPGQPFPTDPWAWMTWNDEHPCMIANGYYSEADRLAHRKWAADGC